MSEALQKIADGYYYARLGTTDGTDREPELVRVIDGMVHRLHRSGEWSVWAFKDWRPVQIMEVNRSF